jgi:hypothetical protein
VTALPPGSTSAAGEAVFSVKAQRRGGFTNEIALTLAGLPEGIGLTLTNIPANTSETSVRLVASDKAPVGKEFTLHINGTGNFNDRLYKHGAEEIKLSVSAPEEPPTLKTAEAK